MIGDCHIHMVLDGIYYKDAIARHRAAPDEGWIRQVLAKYRELGILFLRDGGDACGAGALAARLAPEYGIDYRTPLFPIHRKGHYGAFIGRGFSDFFEYRELVEEARRGGADFIKLMTAGLMDFDHFGVVTDTPVPLDLVRDLIAFAHDQGLAVMVHVNGADAVGWALSAGADSIEHGSYLDDERLHQLAESKAVWVPTAVTIGNLRGKGRFDEAAVEEILAMQLGNIRKAAALGAKIAPGSDAGAWQVFHGQGALDEYALLRQALGEDADRILADGLDEICRRFRPQP